MAKRMTRQTSSEEGQDLLSSEEGMGGNIHSEEESTEQEVKRLRLEGNALRAELEQLRSRAEPPATMGANATSSADGASRASSAARQVTTPDRVSNIPPATTGTVTPSTNSSTAGVQSTASTIVVAIGSTSGLTTTSTAQATAGVGDDSTTPATAGAEYGANEGTAVQQLLATGNLGHIPPIQSSTMVGVPHSAIRVSTNTEILRWQKFNDFGHFKKFKEFVILAYGDVTARNHWLALVDDVVRDALDVTLCTAVDSHRERPFVSTTNDWPDMTMSEIERMIASVYPDINRLKGSEIEYEINKLGAKSLAISPSDPKTLAVFNQAVLEIFRAHADREGSARLVDPHFVSTIPSHIKTLVRRLKAYSSNASTLNYPLHRVVTEYDALRATQADSPVFTDIKKFMAFANSQMSRHFEAGRLERDSNDFLSRSGGGDKKKRGRDNRDNEGNGKTKTSSTGAHNCNHCGRDGHIESKCQLVIQKIPGHNPDPKIAYLQSDAGKANGGKPAPFKPTGGSTKYEKSSKRK